MYNEKAVFKRKGITMLTLNINYCCYDSYNVSYYFLCYKFDSSGAVSKIESRCKRN